MKARLDQILGALEGVLAIHKSLNNALEAQCNLTGSSYRGIQRRITRVLIMGNDEKKLCQRLALAVEALPNDKREFIMGYAEGVIAMANEIRAGTVQTQASA